MTDRGESAGTATRTVTSDDSGERSGVAVVLAGAGARGAYEAGALSVILPALGDDPPNYYIGSSAGGINAVGFSSRSHLDPVTASNQVLDLWRSIGEADVFKSPVPGFVASAYDRVVPGRPRRSMGLLDTAPLHTTLERLLDWDQLHLNLEHGRVDVCGVVVTARSTHRSEVLFESAPPGRVPPEQAIRGIAFRPARLTPAHVVASCSIPTLFPAVSLTPPEGDTDWYVDGGVRLNTPIMPALMLKPRRVVVVTTNPMSVSAGSGDPTMWPPGLTSGLVDILRGVLVDPMVQDLRSLVHGNLVAQNFLARGITGGPAMIDYVFAGPSGADPLGELAGRVLRSDAPFPPPRLVRRVLAQSPNLCELASHILFRPDFIDGAIEAGKADARRQLSNGSVVWHNVKLPT